MSLIDSASLIVTPNAYKEGTLYSVIPSDGSGDLSVTRATTATRVNSAGLVELVPYNLYPYSSSFDNAFWLKNRISVTANQIAAPDGTLTADKVQDTIGTNEDHIFNYTMSFTAGTAYTASFYVKNIDVNHFGIIFVSNAFGTRKDVIFDVQNGTITRQDSGITASIENVGNGWFRCIATSTAATTTITPFGLYFGVTTNPTNMSYTNSVIKGLYLWGAQLVEGSVAKDYQKTETRLNIPRLDYSNGTCPSILVEPQRTNLVTYSSSFDNAAWTKTDSTITANNTTSPSGIEDADKLVENNVNSLHAVSQTYSFTSGTAYTLSFYVKKSERTIIQALFSFQVTTAYCNFNSNTGVFNNQGFTSASMVDVGNGWYRCSVTITSSNTGTYSAFLSIETSINSARATGYTGNGTSGLFLWGAQLEAGSYPTSYIPTTSASVTRNADAISKTGISSLIGQTEGSVFWEGQISSTVGFPQLFDLNADGNKFIQIYNTLVSGVPRIGIYVQNASVLLNNGNIATIAFNTNFRFALAYKNNDYVAYLNGVQVYSNTSTAVPPTSNFGLSAAGQGAETSGKNIKAAVLWKTRLTNDELERLTGVGFNTYTEMANYYNYITQ